MAEINEIPQKARALTSLGDQTAEAVSRLFTREQTSLFPTSIDADFTDLALALQKNNWTDQQAAKLIDSYREALDGGRQVDINDVERWVLAHEDDADAVEECLRVEPPPEIDIIRLLSRKGSQKLVFLAVWRLRQQDVVLKQIRGDEEMASQILAREMQAYPLNLSHPNIIETYPLKNRREEVFLIERRMPEVLSDSWRNKGVHVTANLLYDVARALKFLHEHGLVHGDIKPDNIGQRGEDYVLLDFGMCRREEAFTPETTPTGSLRTRAPELLEGKKRYDEPLKVDVWALGATIYNVLAGRFPFINEEEQVPRTTSMREERVRFEQELSSRVANQWDKWVDPTRLPEQFRHVLERMLERDPQKRISSIELVALVETTLPAYVRSRDDDSNTSRFSPLEALEQIQLFVSNTDVELLPRVRRQQLTDRLRHLRTFPGLDSEFLGQIESLTKTLEH